MILKVFKTMWIVEKKILVLHIDIFGYYSDFIKAFTTEPGTLKILQM